MSIGSTPPPPRISELGQNLRKPLISKRISLNCEVSMQFPHLPGVLKGACSNLSMTGMFVRSRNLAIPGTKLGFEIHLRGQEGIRGHAEVIWVREQGEGPNRRRGMGLRFVGLGSGGRERIHAAVERRILNGGMISDLDEMMSVSEQDLRQTLGALIDTEPAGASPLGSRPAPTIPAEKLHPYAGTAAVPSSSGTSARWLRWLAAAVAAAILVGGLVYFL